MGGKCPLNIFGWQRVNLQATTSFENPPFRVFSELFGNIGRNKGKTN